MVLFLVIRSNVTHELRKRLPGLIGWTYLGSHPTKDLFRASATGVYILWGIGRNIP